MENEAFEKKMKEILIKAGDASNISMEWHVVSADPDRISDFGCDYDGNLVLMEESFPLKISELTHIRYKSGYDCDDWFIRFEFERGLYLDILFDTCQVGEYYNVKYNDIDEHNLTKDQTITLLHRL